MVTSDKIDIKTKTVTKDKRWNYIKTYNDKRHIMIKWYISRNIPTGIDTYAPNIIAPEYIK